MGENQIIEKYLCAGDDDAPILKVAHSNFP
jgi:hypothetical protein